VLAGDVGHAAPTLIWYLAVAVATWIFVVAVDVALGGRFSQQPSGYPGRLDTITESTGVLAGG